MSPPAGSRRPVRALLKLHYACNNRCLFCHSAGQPEPVDGLRRALAKLERLPAGTDQVLLSGGEPTLFPGLRTVQEHLQRRSLAAGFVTNGRMFCYPDFVRDALARGADYFYIALHAGRPLLHDRIAGCPGAWEQTVRGLRNLQRASSAIDLTVNCVVVQANVDRLCDLVDFAARERIGRLKFSVPEVKGRAAAEGRAELAPLGQAAEQVARALRRGDDAGVSCGYDGLPYCLLEAAVRDRVSNLHTHRVFYMSEAWEESFFPTDEGRRMKPPACRDCAYDGVCEGVYAGYAEADALPVRPIHDPVPNHFEFRGCGPLLSPASDCIVEAGVPPPGLSDLRLVLCEHNALVLYEAQSGFFKPNALAQAKRQAQLFRRCAAAAGGDVDALRPLRRSERCRPCPRDDCPGIYTVVPEGRFLSLSLEMRGRLERLSGTVLDVGSGAVRLAGFLFPKGGAPLTYTGIEPDPDACRAAARDHPRATFLNSTLENAALVADSFDFVLMLGSYAHIRDLAAGAGVVRRALKAGGELIVIQEPVFGVVADGCAPRAGEATGRGPPAAGRSEHYRNDGLREAGARLRELGFGLVAAEDVSGDSPFWMLVCRKSLTAG